jgi:hypothetical protein
MGGAVAESNNANINVIATRTISNTSPSKQQQPNQTPQSAEQDCSYEWVLQWALCQET